jgi:hypothetical protein
MSDNLPNDSDGNALQQLVSRGSDLSKPMEIDFAIDIPNREVGLAFATVAGPMGFRTDVDQDDETGDWTCYCSRTMVPSYDAMIEAQRLLEEIGRPFGAKPDGWGSFGNAPENPPISR